MKRSALLQHLRRHGCILKREGGAHSLWTNPTTGSVEAIPRHTEIPNTLARRLAEACRYQKSAGPESGWLSDPRSGSGGR